MDMTAIDHLLRHCTYRNTVVDIVYVFGESLSSLSDEGKDVVRRFIFAPGPPKADDPQVLKDAWEAVK